MKFEIKNWKTQEVLFTAEAENFKSAIEAAVKANANLSYANLSFADLRYANLSFADLRYADLSSADLSFADLRYADLSSADLSFADLRYADLSSADLRYAELSFADLRYANLSSAELSFADLSHASLNDMTRIETGETWSEYKIQVVPALLTAGGKNLHDVVEKSWDCHLWHNCPIAVAFNVFKLSNVPILFRTRANQFIRYFDARLLAKEEILAAVKES